MQRPYSFTRSNFSEILHFGSSHILVPVIDRLALLLLSIAAPEGWVTARPLIVQWTNLTIWSWIIGHYLHRTEKKKIRSVLFKVLTLCTESMWATLQGALICAGYTDIHWLSVGIVHKGNKSLHRIQQTSNTCEQRPWHPQSEETLGAERGGLARC